MKRLNWDRAHLMKTDRRGPRAYLADMRMEAQIERVHISYQSRGQRKPAVLPLTAWLIIEDLVRRLACRIHGHQWRPCGRGAERCDRCMKVRPSEVAK